MSIQIAVLKDGWVLVGDCTLHKQGGRTQQLTINVAHSIRRWGTTKGLGEIANGGPTKETVLDFIGTVWVEPHDLKFLIQCEQDKWKKLGGKI